MSARILITDDDPQIRDVVEIALSQAGFATETAGDGAEGLAKARSGRFDLIVLDIGLPEMDGLAVCRELRVTDQTPIVFLTARDDEIDRILGLEMGGDDYVAKPFSPRELVARIKAILKRITSNPVQNDRTRGGLTISPEQHLVRFRGKNIPLTGREMRVLDSLSARPNHVFSRPHLVDVVYGAGIYVSDRTLDSHLRNLRAKLAAAGCHDAIETLHGIGLRMGACLGDE